MSDAFEQLRLSIAQRREPAVPGADRAPLGGRRAAVLLLFTREADPQLTFTERAATMRKHPGQISFPGGGIEAQDADAADAALREAWEEVGLERRLVTVLGELPTASVARSGFDVTPVIGVWDVTDPLRAVDPLEVAAVHTFRVGELADPAHRVSAFRPGGYRGPAFIMGETFIWGLTAHLLDWTLQLAGWERDWDADRVVDVPERFMRD